jgi:uncharacterized protein with HEPN domain
MKNREFKDFINDIIENSNDIIIFTKGMQYDKFKKDKKTINAVVRSLEIIGEAGKHIPKDIREKYDKIPWNNIINMRNRLIHGYFGVDLEAVWETVISDIPELIEKIREIEKQEFQ